MASSRQVLDSYPEGSQLMLMMLANLKLAPQRAAADASDAGLLGTGGGMCGS